MRLVRLFAAVVGLSFSASLLASCVFNTEDPPEEDPYATEAKFCKALATSVCSADVVTACYLSSDGTLSDDTTKCVEAFSAKGCNPKGFDYQKGGAEPCIVAKRAAYKDGKLTLEEIDEADAACLAVFSGGGASGTDCVADYECDGGSALRCVAKPGGQGTCQVAEEIGAGLSCAAENAICETGFYCGSDEACIQAPGVGKECSETKPCGSSSLCTDGICAAKKANGQSCVAGGECDGGFCVTAQGANSGNCGSTLVLAPTTSDSCAAFLP